MTRNIKRRVEYGAKQGCVVRVYREEVEDGWFTGYIVATGPEFFALEIIDDGIRFDGFTCMRYAEVSDCDVPAPHAEFHEAALRLRGLTRASKFEPDVSDLASLLRTAAEAYPLVTIHLEIEDPDCCYIGKVGEVSYDKVEMQTIAPGARWDEEIYEYDLDEITRVDFGGAYEDALWIVSEQTKRPST